MKQSGRKLIAGLAAGAVMAFGVVQASLADDVTSIAVLVPEQGTDFGWNQQGVDAARAVADMHGLEFMPAEGLGYGDVRPTLRELAEDGASLMIAHASGYNTAAPEIAAETGVPVAITVQGRRSGYVSRSHRIFISMSRARTDPCEVAKSGLDDATGSDL